MPDYDNDIEDQLKALREAYAVSLPEKFAQIKACHAGIMSGDDDVEEKIILLHRLLHGIAGSGATFGFSELGQKARQIEQIIKKWMVQRDRPCSEEKTEVSNLLTHFMALNGVVAGDTDAINNKLARVSSQNAEAANVLIYILDDVELENGLAVQISNYGYEVEIYANIKDFLIALNVKIPDAVVVDINLSQGDLSGVNVIRKFKQEQANDLIVLFISSADNFQARLEAVQAGGEAYITKPINVDYLIEQLDKLIKSDTPEPYRILIVDDDISLSTYYKLVLNKAGMKVEVLNQPEKIFELMASFNPELILMDIYMPVCSGLDLAKLIRQQDSFISIPIVYLSTESDNAKKMDALDSGGDDFLTKPIDDEKLMSSVTIRVRRARKLGNLMSQDSLTGLLKHTKIKARLANELSRAMRNKSQMIFVMVDIDNFKLVNDTYGHLVGDQVIKSLARLLQQRLRKSDGIGRYGGEEFAIVLPDASMQNAEVIVNEIRENFSKIEFLHEGEVFNVTISAGISGYPLHDDAVLINKAADDALYRAKENGRDCVVMESGSH